MNPASHILRLKAQGHQIVACFPLYPPLALIHAAGMVPIVPWGLKSHVSMTETADRHLPPYTCSVARHMTEYLLTHARDGIDGIFIYNACDTLRNLPEILADEMGTVGREVPFFRMHLPMTRRDLSDSSAFFRNEISVLTSAISEHSGIRFTPGRFQASVALYRRMRRLALGAEDGVADGRLDFSAFSDVMQSGFFMPVEDHIQVLEKLVAAGSANPAAQTHSEKNRTNVLISGILPPPASLIAVIESAGLRIVGNDIASLHRSYAVMPDPMPDAGTYYSVFYDAHFPCPTLLYTADRRVDALVRLCLRRNAQAVIFIGEKFCEYEYFEFPFLTKKLAEKGISALEIELSIEDGHGSQLESRIAAFAEMIRH